MDINNCMLQATDIAHKKTEEDCQDYGMAVQYDESGKYTKEAKGLFDEHYSRELKRLLDENNLTEEDIKNAFRD